MKTKILKTILPPTFGILSVLLLLIIFNLIFHNGNAFTKPDNGFFKYFVPTSLISAIIIQFTLILPFWEILKINKKILGLTLIKLTGINCIISGLFFGLIFWERNLGFNELILLSLSGIIAFTVYWTVNIIILKQIDKMIT